MRLLLLKQAIFVLLSFLIFSVKTIGQTSTSGLAYIWSAAGTWTPTAIPASTTNVTTNSPLTLDQNLTISSGNYTFNQDVTDHPGGSDYNLTNLNASGSLTIASGTTTIGGITSIGGNTTFTLTVKAGATLVLGTFGSTTDNFLIGNKVDINIELGGTIIVYGNIVNSNSSGSFNVNGLLQVYGDYKTDNGNIDINGTTGQFYTTGAMQTQGNSSTIYGSSNDCTSNCSGTSLGCGTGGISYTATITPKNQTVCSGGVINTMTFSTNAPSTIYQWEYSSSEGGTYIAISGATTNTYSPLPLTVTTWYRVKYTSAASGCGTKYSAPVPVYVSASTYTQSTSGQTVCAGVFGPISVSALGTGLTYQWYSNISANNSGGTLISGAVSNVFTPPSNTNGTKYYYCVINSSCGTPYTTAISGAFTVNLNTVTAASSSPTPCVNTVMTSIRHTTTRTTGIGTATGLPTGVTALWTSNTITISGTPTQSGTFNYSIPLTGGCGSVSATGTITVNPNASIASLSGTSPLCISGTSTYTANSVVLGGGTGTWSSSNTAIATVNSSGLVTGVAAGSANIVYTITGGCGGTVSASQAVTISAYPNNVTNGFVATTICAGGSPQLTYDAEDVTFTTPYSITYKNDTTLQQYTVTIPNASPYNFTPGDNPITNTGYTIVSISNATCTRTSGIINPGANLIVRPMPTATISGTANVCVGDPYPNIKFTNSQSVAVTVTYTINEGVNQTINIAANSYSNIAVATTTPGPFVFKLVSVVYQSTPNCSNNISGSATVTVNPNLPASVSISASPSGAICSGTSVTFIATPTNGGITPTYQWYNGATLISGATFSTYTSTTLANTDAIKVVMTSNATPCLTGSSATSNAIMMAVNPLLTVPTLGTIIQPTCTVQTGSFSITNYSSSYVYSVSPSTGVTISGSTVTAPAGSYTIIATSGSCTAASTPAVITPLEVVTYNGASWSASPTINKIGEIQASGAILVNTELCSCTVNSGVNTTVNSGVTLKLQDRLTVTGALTFENNASLVQVNDAAVNSGNINYKRHTAAVRRYDFTYWSSPVGGQTLYNLSPNTLGDKYYSYVPDLGWKIWYNGAKEMEPGEGYIIRAPQTFSITTAAVDVNPMFIGKPNNGVIPLTLSGDKLYLLGNPYPSAINADTFLDVNSAVLEGTLYFWTHNTAIQLASNITNGTAGSGTYAYTSDDYATYNRTGGVATRVSTADPADTGGLPPTGKIAAGQGFFAPASTVGGTLVFNNSMRIAGGASGINNLQFFKVSPTSKASSDAIVATQKNRVWLDLTNKEGVFKQTLVGYLAGATNNYEGSFDGVTYDGNQFVDFYSINQGVNLSIQGRALPFEKLDTVSLGYKSTIKGEFQISIDHTDGILSSQQVFLEDKDLKVLHDLKKEPYIFNTPVGVFNNRFVLRYIDKNAVQKEVAKTPILNEAVLVSVQHNEITVSAAPELIAKISLYDVSGKLIYENAKIAARDFVIQHLVSSEQMLVVRVVLENEEVVSTKIIY